MLTNPPIRGPRHTLSANEGHLKIDPATVFTAPILADLRHKRAGIYDPDHTQPVFLWRCCLKSDSCLMINCPSDYKIAIAKFSRPDRNIHIFWQGMWWQSLICGHCITQYLFGSKDCNLTYFHCVTFANSSHELFVSYFVRTDPCCWCSCCPQISPSSWSKSSKKSRQQTLFRQKWASGSSKWVS